MHKITPDLIITFRASPKIPSPKHKLKEDIRKAEQQYKRLLETLNYAGLKAVGRRGESLGHLMIFVECPKEHVVNLVKRERHSDFMYGLPTSRLPSEPVNLDAEPLAPSDRLRLVYAYVTSTPADGGLGISPDSHEWDLVESVVLLHDKEFNDAWVKSWTYKHIAYASVSLSRVRDQYGEAVAMYFAFLSTYTRALIFPAFLGFSYYIFGSPYSPVYSILLLLWSTVFTEYWRVRERLLSLQFGTRGSFRVEKRRAQYKQGFSWWKRELRVLASVPMIAAFIGILTILLTAIFIFEAFVTHLYNGPGHQLVGFSPTILFVLLVPRLVGLYQAIAKKFTIWENHAHQSTFDASLTLKSFILAALVAYSGLALSAFVYVPFGEGVMRVVQVWIFDGLGAKAAGDVTSGDQASFVSSSVNAAAGGNTTMWVADVNSARGKLNPGRLRDQMFAYTVTNQVVNTFIEVGLPYVTRAIGKFRQRKANATSTEDVSPSGSNASVSSLAHSPSNSGNGGTKKKRVVFEDETAKGGMEEREFLERVRAEVALPEYELFGDYSEMVMQFGYVALWSTIWPLAPVMALINNILELRSDAFKITVHHRRPVPQRTDTIGPWLDALTFLTWCSALSNSALVYLFCPRSQCDKGTPANQASPASNSTTSLWTTLPFLGGGGEGGMTPIERVHKTFFSPSSPSSEFASAASELLISCALIALVASHGYLLLRVLVRHVVERVVWRGSEVVRERERRERDVKEGFLATRSVGGVEKGGEMQPVEGALEKRAHGEQQEGEVFWGYDEGMDEIGRIAKEA